MIRLRALALVFLTLLLGLASSALAEERILSFHSAIDIAESGKLTVTETIRVIADGTRIKRGIFRDFPLTFEGSDGRLHRVDFNVVKIERDGEAEDYFRETIDNGTRIYIGKKDVYLSGGEHVFEITYETGRQIRYFDKHDELFWNVTGNGWEFPIDEASATVTLPGGAKPEATVFFTGPVGATEKNARVLNEDGEIFFATTSPMRIREGLTIGVKMPKGAIDAPSASDEFWWMLHDRENSLLALGGLILVGTFFAWQWIRVGRDPAKGILIPRWDPPAGLSPALVNYVANNGFSGGGWTAFSASAIDLAVKGHIVLQDLKEGVTLRRTGSAPKEPLPLGEDIIYNAINQTTGELVINKASGITIQALGERFRTAIDKEHRGKYHRYNLGVIVWGLLLTIVSYIAILLIGEFKADMLGLMVVPAFAFVFVAIFSAVLAAMYRSSPAIMVKIIAGFFLFLFWSAMTLIIVVCAIEAVKLAQSPDDLLALGATAATVVLALFFTTIMGAATPLGRELKDGVEGMVLYLTVAEKNRMNMVGAPAMSPQHFEKMLPYAVALGVEKPWANAFQTWLSSASAATAAASYHPGWYAGQDFDSRHFGDRMSSFSSSLSSTIASTIPAPVSSSSSGFSSSSSSGGSSGGGGGGGGGGGW